MNEDPKEEENPYRIEYVCSICKAISECKCASSCEKLTPEDRKKREEMSLVMLKDAIRQEYAQKRMEYHRAMHKA